MEDVLAAVALGHQGHPADAAALLEVLWESAGPDALRRVTIAHFLADLQADPVDELRWDQLALDAVHALTDARAAAHHESLQARGFLPSLHLNLADVHRRLGHDAAAREHLGWAQEHVDALSDDAYGSVVRAGIGQVGDALDRGDRGRLPSAPGRG